MSDRGAPENLQKARLQKPALSILAGATILALDPNTIDVDLSGRIGLYFPDKAVAMGRLMFADGQRDICKVSKAPAGSEFAWRLHVGLHRTMGARFEGLDLHCVEVSGTPEFLRELEASENTHRRKQEPIERAKFVHALCQAAQERIAREHGELKQHQLAVKARWDRVKAKQERVESALLAEIEDTSDKMSRVYGWQETAAAALDLDKRTIQRALRLYRLVIEPFPDLVADLAMRVGVGENEAQLKLIADVHDEGLRRQVIEAVLADSELSVDMARVKVGVEAAGEPAPSPETKIATAVTANLGRLSATSQKSHLRSFVRALKSDEVKRQLRDMLNEELGEVPAEGEATLDLSGFLGGRNG